MNAHRKFISSPPTSSFRHSALILAVGLISSTLSCSFEPMSSTGPGSARVIERLTPTDVEATAGSIVEPSPAIRLKDRLTGKPLVGVTVEFRADHGSGSVERPVTTTDASGFATAGLWQVGTRSGRFALTVVVADVKTSFYVQVKADVPARFEFTDKILVGLTGELIDGPRLVLVDRFGNPTPGIPVTFTIVAGGGALATPTGLTDRDGRTWVGPWRVGSTPGENAVIATAAGIEPVRFTALALDPATMTRYTLDAVRQGTTVRTLPWGVSQSTLSITAFDRCLCRSQAGHYVIAIDYGDQPTVEPKRIAGEYAIEPPLLRLVGKEIKSITVVDGGGIEIEIERGDDWDGRWVETWIYRPDAPP